MRSSVRKYMCVLVVKGTYKRHFFSKRVAFEIYFYYTPIKKKIIDFKFDGVMPSKIGIGQVIGHGIEEVEELCTTCGFSFFHIER